MSTVPERHRKTTRHSVQTPKRLHQNSLQVIVEDKIVCFGLRLDIADDHSASLISDSTGHQWTLIYAGLVILYDHMSKLQTLRIVSVFVDMSFLYDQCQHCIKTIFHCLNILTLLIVALANIMPLYAHYMCYYALLCPLHVSLCFFILLTCVIMLLYAPYLCH